MFYFAMGNIAEKFLTLKQYFQGVRTGIIEILQQLLPKVKMRWHVGSKTPALSAVRQW